MFIKDPRDDDAIVSSGRQCATLRYLALFWPGGQPWTTLPAPESAGLEATAQTPVFSGFEARSMPMVVRVIRLGLGGSCAESPNNSLAEPF